MTDLNRAWSQSWGAERDAVPDRLPAQCPECREQGCGLTGSTWHHLDDAGRMEFSEARKCDACGHSWREVYECVPERAVAWPSGPVSGDEGTDPMPTHGVGGDRGVAGPYGPYPWLTEDDVADD